MEEMEQEKLFGIEINEDTIDHFRETAKWVTFLSILGFIGVSFILIFLFFMAFIVSATTPLAGIPMFFFSCLVLCIYCVPLYYFFKFAQTMKSALRDIDSFQFAESIGFLKSAFKFMGIYFIVVISIYVGLLFLGGLGGLLL